MQTPYSAPYRDANIIQKSLFQRIISSDIQDKDKGLLARVWVEIEAFKREMRGIPRLSSHSLQDLAMARSSLAKRLTTRGAIDEAPDAPAQAKPADIEPNEPKHASKPADP